MPNPRYAWGRPSSDVVMNGRNLTWVWVLAALTQGCASLPQPAPQRGLYMDLRKAVELSDDTGWVVDRVQLEANEEAALRSLCQVEPHARDDLDAWIGGQLALAGGPAEDIYRQTGDLDDAGESLTLERTRALLRHASASASEDCPFWLEPDPEFAGVEGDADRLVLLLETRGFGGVLLKEDDAILAAGGGARVLVGHGVGARLTLAVGGEVGGFGGLEDNEAGTRRIDATITAATPALLRFSSFGRIVDLELSPVWRFRPEADEPPTGVRVNAGYGFAALRTSAFMPYLVLWAGYEYQPADHASPEDHAVMLGSRVGVDLDP